MAALAQSVPSTLYAAVDASGRAVVAKEKARPGSTSRVSADGPCGQASELPLDAAQNLVRRIATEERFYPDFVSSVAKIESRYSSIALSAKGAYGLMQLTAETAERYGVDRCDPGDNVRGGIRYLRALHQRYRNPLFILAAYNAGEDAVLKNRGVPAYPETVRFVADVLNDFYTWPSAAAAKGGPKATSAPRSAGAVDVAAAIPSAEPTSASPTAEPRWSGGFVMHID